LDLNSKNGTVITITKKGDAESLQGLDLGDLPGCSDMVYVNDEQGSSTAARFTAGGLPFRLSKGDILSVGQTDFLVKHVFPIFDDRSGKTQSEPALGQFKRLNECRKCRIDVVLGFLRCTECGTPLCPDSEARKSAKRF
jgi:hypothetical protein